MHIKLILDGNAFQSSPIGFGSTKMQNFNIGRTDFNQGDWSQDSKMALVARFV